MSAKLYLQKPYDFCILFIIDTTYISQIFKTGSSSRNVSTFVKTKSKAYPQNDNTFEPFNPIDCLIFIFEDTSK